MTIHPAAWWVWALSLALAASLTTNPVLLGCICCAATAVVLARRTQAPWALGFRMYAWLALVIVVIRVAYRIIFTVADGGTVLFTLPSFTWHVGSATLVLFGSVSVQNLLSGLYDGLRLATMVLCVGAANSLANPKRLLKALPGALHEISTAIVVALSVFPQLVESVQRVILARKLRGGSAPRRHLVRDVLMPVLADALDRSLGLAAAMDSRGYGRRSAIPPGRRTLTGLLMIMSVMGTAAGLFGLLDSGAPGWLRWPMLGLGLATGFAALSLAGRAVHRSIYRPDRWTAWSVAYCLLGLLAPLAFVIAGHAASSGLVPVFFPLTMPALPLIPLLGIVAAVLPAVVPLAPLPAPAHHQRAAA